MYYEGGVSSVYLWDLDHGFAAVLRIKKAGDGSKMISGCWDSIHVVEMQEKTTGRTAHYKLTSTAMLWLQTNKQGSGTMNLGGSLTRQTEQDANVSESSPKTKFAIHSTLFTLARPRILLTACAAHSPSPISVIRRP